MGWLAIVFEIVRCGTATVFARTGECMFGAVSKATKQGKRPNEPSRGRKASGFVVAVGAGAGAGAISIAGAEPAQELGC